MVQVRHLEVDSLVVGAGLAGCALGYLLASASRDVLVVELKDAAIKAKLCAGVFDSTNHAVDNVFGEGFLERAGACLVPLARTRTGEESRPRGNVRCIERKALDNAALASCRQAGATILDRIRIERIDFAGKVAQATDLRTGEGVSVSYCTLVGADGAASQVRRLATHRRQRTIPSVQSTVLAPDQVAVMEFFVDAAGYCWYFPFSSAGATAGACAYSPMSARQLKDRLQDFCARRGYTLDKLQGAPIPSGDDTLLSAGQDVWLIGDAAGLAAPSIGCGMQFACASAAALADQILRGASYLEALGPLCREFQRAADSIHAREKPR